MLHTQSASSAADLLLCAYDALPDVSQLSANFLLVSVSPGDVINQKYNIVAHYQFKEEGLVLIKNKVKSDVILYPKGYPLFADVRVSIDPPKEVQNIGLWMYIARAAGRFLGAMVNVITVFFLNIVIKNNFFKITYLH